MILLAVSFAICDDLLSQLVKVSLMILILGHLFIVIQSSKDDFIAEANGFEYFI